jgi:glyoxylase-like metal-dependent hydrolase (beta-lactamase superfamily II)
MGPGDLDPVTAGDAADVYCLDVDMLGVPQYGAVYLIDSPRPAVLDTGTGANHEWILAALADLGIEPEDLAVIAPTHVHLDHAGGAGYLARACPNADVYIHERGARHLAEPGRIWEGTKAAVRGWIDGYAEPVPVPEDRIVELRDGDAIDLGDRELSVHHAPGHAPHQTVFADPASDCVFVGDAAGLYVDGFDGPRPTTPPANFDLDQCLADIEMLRRLDPAGLCFPHCGAAPADGLLEGAARVLEDWVAEVEAARRAVGSDDVDAIVDRLDPWPDVAAIWGEGHVRQTQALNVRGVLAARE